MPDGNEKNGTQPTGKRLGTVSSTPTRDSGQAQNINELVRGVSIFEN